MHENGFTIKTPTCKGTQDPRELSISGFINTTIILQKSEHSESDNVEEDSDEEINDVSLYSSTPKSIGQTRNQSSRYEFSIL